MQTLYHFCYGVPYCSCDIRLLSLESCFHNFSERGARTSTDFPPDFRLVIFLNRCANSLQSPPLLLLFFLAALPPLACLPAHRCNSTPSSGREISFSRGFMFSYPIITMTALWEHQRGTLSSSVKAKPHTVLRTVRTEQ